MYRLLDIILTSKVTKKMYDNYDDIVQEFKDKSKYEKGFWQSAVEVKLDEWGIKVIWYHKWKECTNKTVTTRKWYIKGKVEDVIGDIKDKVEEFTDNNVQKKKSSPKKRGDN